MIWMVSNADDIDANNGRWKKGGWVKTGDWGLSSFLCSLPRNSPVHCRSAGPAQSSKRHSLPQSHSSPYNCFKWSEKCQFAPDPVFWGFADVTLVNEDTKSTYWWSQELQCGNEIYNQWIGIQEPQTEYYSLVQPVLVKAFKKMASVGQRYALELESRKGGKRWKRRLWLCNRPFSNRSVIM